MKPLLLLFLSFATSYTLPASPLPYNIIVATDGSGNFRTVQEAFNSAPDNSPQRTIIYIKHGTYKQKLLLPATKKNITIVGEDSLTTILTYDDYSKRIVGTDTINTQTLYSTRIDADGFIAENITFENSAGMVGQAVALMTCADKAIFKNCRLIGNQDILLTQSTGRCYFANCYIEGTTDFIFGASIALFENCHIHSKKNSYITAASTPEGNKFGYVFRHCTLTGDTTLDRVYLGRPWRPYSRVAYIDCTLGKHITAAGWDNWRNPDKEKTVYYAEYNSKGPGAAPTARVPWSKQLSQEDAENYTIDHIFAKEAAAIPFIEDWNPLESFNNSNK